MATNNKLILHLLLGDLLASLTVGTSLYIAYRNWHGGVWLPVALGYLVPILVFCFTTAWNRLSFSASRAAGIALGMGSLFAAVHVFPVAAGGATTVGYVAPLIVAWVTRKVSEGKDSG